MRVDPICMMPGFSAMDVWWAIALIAAWLVWLCLKTIATDLQHAKALHDLKVRARRLRQEQLERLAALRAKL